MAGGGAIGIEFAQMFHRFGVSVTVLERSSYPLDKEDRELADQLCDLLTAEGIHIETEAELQHVQKISDGKQLTYRCKDGPQQELVASARQHSGQPYPGSKSRRPAGACHCRDARKDTAQATGRDHHPLPYIERSRALGRRPSIATANGSCLQLVSWPVLHIGDHTMPVFDW
jgi:hypothetical protein